MYLLSSVPCPLISLSLVHRRWVRLEMKGKGITWTSGQFIAGNPYGCARRPSASATRPPTHCCLWRGSSMDGRSMVREKFTPCQAPASTACGRPWRASLWNPVRTQQAAAITVTHTQSSDLDFSSLLLSFHFFFFLSTTLFLPLSLITPTAPHFSFFSLINFSIILWGDCAKVCLYERELWNKS